ncbi:DUF6286 domain-containing protein [Streptomyces sp. HNM0663]|uniref:DUF6286 domain-containing protein n=1 Tax=Streptomyces chengmaiensis TaxID=3040919 RepID=A0ABT6HQR1_9ACTN|nr:DUF6286 domain-containing protein [Streptomyces chengmaiensis]MDH2390384.1 DUF6286 domain-containing protein [Streptomyces chengmaiensis]
MSEPPSRPDAEATEGDGGGEGGVPGRFWSVRRVPAALAALTVLAAAGLLLYDVAAVRAGRPGMAWRRALAEDLATLRLDETPVLVGAGIAAALGVWLIVLALTPGLRAVLPMRRAEGIVRAGLDRDAAARVLRDRATEVAGVQSARVRVGRTSVSVRARSHFRELDEVRADLDAVLDAGLRELGLAVRPALSVYVDQPSAPRER